MSSILRSHRPAQMASGVLVTASEPPPSATLVTSSNPLTPSHPAGPVSMRAPLQFVCADCWHTFVDGSLPVCVCERPRPEKGWAAMPYLFRGRYLFVDLLGRGGMGAVFRAYDQAGGDNPWVAVKVVSQGSPERALLRKEMFQKEAAAAQMLAQHKQFFVSVLGHDGVDPAYLALEHVSWQTLGGLRESHPRGARGLPPSQVARIGIAVLRGVARMHFHRIVHQDLTPANIFVNHRPEGEGYEVKITDLGIWTHDQVQWDSEALTLVAKPGISGTPNYMSPEQSMGQAVSSQSDLHTVGSVLWELATAEVPYPADVDLPPHEFLDLRVKALQKPLPRPQGMPHFLYKILVRALEFQPEARWSSAPEMCKALEAFVEQCRAQRQGDPGASSRSLVRVSQQVTALEENLTPMRGLLDRLSALGAMIRQASAERDDLDPDEMHAVADEAEREIDEIVNELSRLTHKSSLRPPKLDLEPVDEITATVATGQPVPATTAQIVPSGSAGLPAQSDTAQKRPGGWLEQPPWTAMGIALAVVVLVVGYLAFRSEPESPDRAPPAAASAAPDRAPPAPPPASLDSPAPAGAAAVEPVEPVEPVEESPANSTGKAPKTAKTPAGKTPAAATSGKGQRSLIQENPYQ